MEKWSGSRAAYFPNEDQTIILEQYEAYKHIGALARDKHIYEFCNNL